MEDIDTQSSQLEGSINLNDGGHGNMKDSLESIIKVKVEATKVEDSKKGIDERSLASQEPKSDICSLSSQEILNLQSSLPFTIDGSVEGSKNGIDERILASQEHKTDSCSLTSQEILNFQSSLPFTIDGSGVESLHESQEKNLASQEPKSDLCSLNLQYALPLTNDDKYDWSSFVVEKIEKALEIPRKGSVVASQPPSADTDWTDHFKTDQVFETTDDMRSWLMKKAKEAYMVLVVGRSNYRPGRLGRVTYICHRGGKFDDKPRKKKIGAAIKASGNDTQIQTVKSKKCGTNKCECPFMIKGTSKTYDYKQWEIEVVCGKHNHDLSPYVEGHAYHGRLSQTQKENFTQLSKAGIKPKQILKIIKDEDPENSTSLQTIYNVKKKIVKEVMEDRTVIQQLMKQASEREFIANDRRSVDGDIMHDLFLAHPDSVSLCHAFPYIFLMDSTYKTNIHKWPLFTIVGVTSTMMTFSVAYIFMEQETTEHFVWALERFRDVLDSQGNTMTIVTDRDQALINAIGVVFPSAKHLLCRWHIENGIVKKGHAILPKEDGKDGNDDNKLKAKWKSDWNSVVFSSTEEEFMENLDRLKQEWKEYPELYEYVEKEWINSHKEKFVSAWTDKILHFGNVTTGRVESAHSALKDMMRRSSRNSLLTTFDYIKANVDHQVNEIKKSFTVSLVSRSHEHRLAIFNDIVNYVSTACLSFLREQYNRYKEGCIDRKTCGCVSVSSYGIPCACWIADIERSTKRITLLDLHDFWKKLSISPARLEHDDLSLAEEYRLLCKKWKTASEHVRRDMLRRMRDISMPQTTWLTTPPNPVKPKGRPSKKKRAKPTEWDTKREPSAHEIEVPSVPKAPDGQHYYDPNVPPSKKKKLSQKSKGKRQPIEGEEEAREPVDNSETRDKQVSVGIRRLVYMHASVNKAGKRDDFERYKKHLPDEKWEEFVETIINVEGDGNCGFRAVAKALSLPDDSGWKDVRRDLIDEVLAHRNMYDAMFGGHEETDKIINSLNCFESPVPNVFYWMSIPAVGYMIASCYGVVYIHLSRFQALTFYPQHTRPPLDSTPENIPVISTLHTGDHYVFVQLKVNSPFPPAASFSKKFRQSCAIQWDSICETRHELHRKLFPMVNEDLIEGTEKLPLFVLE